MKYLIIQNIYVYSAPICPPPKVIHNADMTRAEDYDYIGQIVSYTCKPGYEFTDEDLEPVNVTERIREDHSKLVPSNFNIVNFHSFSQSLRTY